MREKEGQEEKNSCEKNPNEIYKIYIPSNILMRVYDVTTTYTNTHSIRLEIKKRSIDRCERRRLVYQ